MCEKWSQQQTFHCQLSSSMRHCMQNDISLRVLQWRPGHHSQQSLHPWRQAVLSMQLIKRTQVVIIHDYSIMRRRTVTTVRLTWAALIQHLFTDLQQQLYCSLRNVQSWQWPHLRLKGALHSLTDSELWWWPELLNCLWVMTGLKALWMSPADMISHSLRMKKSHWQWQMQNNRPRPLRITSFSPCMKLVRPFVPAVHLTVFLHLWGLFESLSHSLRFMQLMKHTSHSGQCNFSSANHWLYRSPDTSHWVPQELLFAMTHQALMRPDSTVSQPESGQRLSAWPSHSHQLQW